MEACFRHRIKNKKGNCGFLSYNSDFKEAIVSYKVRIVWYKVIIAWYKVRIAWYKVRFAWLKDAISS